MVDVLIFQNYQYIFKLCCQLRDVFKLFLGHSPLSKLFHYMAHLLSSSLQKGFCYFVYYLLCFSLLFFRNIDEGF